MNDAGPRIDYADPEWCLALIAGLPLTRVSVVYDAHRGISGGLRQINPVLTRYAREMLTRINSGRHPNFPGGPNKKSSD